MKDIKTVLSHIDTTYAYEFAKKMESYRCHPELGYRTAGSMAEKQTGEMIASEMKKIGLKKVSMDEISLDGWNFSKAHLSFANEKGIRISCELGGYQTQFDTCGPREYTLIYLNKGTTLDYEGVDVKGKLVLIEINQRDEWWINYPVYQAHLKGAAAVLAVQKGGYGQVDPHALNAQDIAGPSEAAAFSISQSDAAILKKLCGSKGEVKVIFDARSEIMPNVKSYNIVGQITGRQKDRMILFSAHYDSYFSGFQDDNTAVSMMLSIAKAVKKSGLQPEKTWVFCAMAAEEWGVINSKYDWSTGAYEEVFTVHPNWHTQTDIDFNFELPALAHGPRDYVRSTYEYQTELKACIQKIQPPAKAYPKGAGVISPIVTWSDDFSLAINGIPSTVNDFSEGRFMETHYHSQFDNESVYDEAVYRYHHELYIQLAIHFDQLILAPMQFKTLFSALKRSLKKTETSAQNKEKLTKLFDQAMHWSDQLYAQIKKINTQGIQLLKEGKRDQFDKLFNKYTRLNQKLLALFKRGQDEWVRINWHDEVYFPHVLVSDNLKMIQSAQSALKKKEIQQALKALYHIDNNRYAFLFDERVYDYFTHYVTDQPEARLKWGYNRVMPHENLFELVQVLKQEKNKENPELQESLRWLEKVKDHQETLLQETLIKAKAITKDFIDALNRLSETFQ